MAPVFTAFIAHRFSDQNERHFKLFTSLLQALEFKLDIYDYQELDSLTAAVRNRIASADCVVAIVSVDQAPADGARTGSEWVRQEIAAAVALQKPLVVLSEEGLPRPPFADRMQSFNRDLLPEIAPLVVKYFLSLRAELSARLGNLLTPPIEFLRHRVHLRDEFVSADILIARASIELESLSNEFRTWSHQMNLEDATPGVSIKAQDLQVQLVSAPAGVALKYEFLQNTDAQVRFRITLSRALKIGDRLTYSFKIAQNNPQPFTRAELDRRINAGTYKYDEPLCDACDWMIMSPTRELTYEAEWPSGYELTNIQADARHMGDWTIDVEESKRMDGDRLLTAERLIDKWYVKLHVPSPIYTRLYKVRYCPVD